MELRLGRHISDEHQSYEVVAWSMTLKSGVSDSQLVAYLPLTRRQLARPPVGWHDRDGPHGWGRGSGHPGSPSQKILSPLISDLNIFNLRTLSDYLGDQPVISAFCNLYLWRYRRVWAGAVCIGTCRSHGLRGCPAKCREIGIRMALGARRTPGVAAGSARRRCAGVRWNTSWIIGRIRRGQNVFALTSVFVNALYIGTGDFRLLVGAPLLSGSLALLACYIPAKKSCHH